MRNVSDAKPKSGRWGLLIAAAVFLPVAAGVLILYFFNPEHNGFYPRCLLYQMTGLLCPACGSLRALHQLTHGNIAAAFHFNPLLIILLPIVAWTGLRTMAWQVAGKKWPAIFQEPIWGWILLAVVVVFGVLRNIL